jgi:hypothetical protein
VRAFEAGCETNHPTFNLLFGLFAKNQSNSNLESIQTIQPVMFVCLIVWISGMGGFLVQATVLM